MTILTVLAGLTAYAAARVAEAYVKKYRPDVWADLNRWDD